MDKTAKQNMVNDIENRLDTFFGDGEDKDKAEEKAKGDEMPLNKLKSVVLSIDWEITEDCLTELIDEVSVLSDRFSQDKLTYTLLRMLHSLGKYIRKRKAQAHPDAIKRIMSIYDGLEKMVTDTTIDEAAKKQIIAKEINAFKQLKSKVEAQRIASAPAGGSTAASPGPDTWVAEEKFQKAMSSVEKRLGDEVQSLKKQLDALRNELDRLRKA